MLLKKIKPRSLLGLPAIYLLFDGLNARAKKALVGVDGLGFKVEEASEILKVEPSQLREQLSKARQVLLASQQNEDLSVYHIVFLPQRICR